MIHQLNVESLSRRDKFGSKRRSHHCSLRASSSCRTCPSAIFCSWGSDRIIGRICTGLRWVDGDVAYLKLPSSFALTGRSWLLQFCDVDSGKRNKTVQGVSQLKCPAQLDIILGNYSAITSDAQGPDPIISGQLPRMPKEAMKRNTIRPSIRILLHLT